MIKGVNKNVIEISDTGNECFEGREKHAALL